MYLAYFRELDSVTEYCDVYGRPPDDYLMPDVFKYFGNGKALDLWRKYIVIPDDDPTKVDAKTALDQELARPEIQEAIKIVDLALIALVRKHFPSADSVDLEMFFDAFLRFGSDRLPLDPDRLKRIQDLNNPGDFRLSYAQYHRMDSNIMWINWMGHVECAVTLYGKQDPAHQIRTGLMASVCLGYSADCVFRNRGQTRPEYYKADGEDRMWRKSALIANDFDKASTEAHVLARLQANKQTAAALALDLPIRFQILRNSAHE